LEANRLALSDSCLGLLYHIQAAISIVDHCLERILTQHWDPTRVWCPWCHFQWGGRCCARSQVDLSSSTWIKNTTLQRTFFFASAKLTD
jgi:hypothetical protein